jgi:flagellar basal-body rod protein FlgF
MLENTVYIALSRQLVLNRQIDVVANNLANMNTTAYKTQRMLFEEYLVKTEGGQQMSFVQDVAVARNLEDGELSATGSPLDMALSGRGYFVVETPEGLRYTRNGHFRFDEEGRLVTQDGLPVLDEGGKPIQVNLAETQLQVSTDGTVATGPGQTSKLQVVGFANEYKLSSVGAGLYETAEPPQPVPATKVMQGMLEGSNVQPILEINSMIELSRAYQSTQQMLENDHDLRRRTIRQLAQVA